jgi:quercetin dioxygenase-like cupin family protein
MRRILLLSVLATLVAGVVSVGLALSTPGSGITSAPINARGLVDGKIRMHGNAPADVVFQTITVAPGGQTGWHSHPGPAAAVVKSGTLTLYWADEPCTAVPYAAGSGFFERGYGTVHKAVNEGTEPVEVWVTYFDVPAQGSPRVDASAPSESCS